MTKEEINKFCEEKEIELLLADGFEEALIGYSVERWQTKVVELAIYDRAKCIDILVKRDHMTEEEAEEYFQFNVEGAFVGEQTPIFIYPIGKLAHF